MKVELELKEVDLAMVALSNLTKLELPIKVAYRLGKALNELKKEHAYFLEARDKLIQKYGQKDETGKFRIENNSIRLQKGKEEEFLKLFSDLSSEKVVIEVTLVPFSMFTNDIKFNFLDMSSISFLFVDDETK
jgi:hypothetical protein